MNSEHYSIGLAYLLGKSQNEHTTILVAPFELCRRARFVFNVLACQWRKWLQLRPPTPRELGP